MFQIDPVTGARADRAYLAFFAAKLPPILVDTDDAERPGSPGARLHWAARVGADKMVKAANDVREAEGVEPIVVVASWESKAGRGILSRLYGASAGEVFESMAGVMVRAFTEAELAQVLGPELSRIAKAPAAPGRPPFQPVDALRGLFDGAGGAQGAPGEALRVLFAVTGASFDPRVLRAASGEEIVDAVQAAQPKPPTPPAAPAPSSAPSSPPAPSSSPAEEPAAPAAA